MSTCNTIQQTKLLCYNVHILCLTPHVLYTMCSYTVHPVLYGTCTPAGAFLPAAAARRLNLGSPRLNPPYARAFLQRAVSSDGQTGQSGRCIARLPINLLRSSDSG